MDKFGKIPPQATEIESAVLGAVMIDSEAINEINFLKPEVFYRDDHQKIYDAIQSLNSENKKIDILTVTEKLKQNGQLDEIGGALYITQLTANIASSAHIREHAQIIFEKFKRREILRIANELTIKAFDEGIDLEEIFTMISGESDTLFDVGETTGAEMHQIVSSVFDLHKYRQKLIASGQMAGIQTPLTTLNRLTGGWTPGNLIVIGARPGAGKTAFALECAIIDSLNGGFPLFFSMEMRAVELGERIVLGESQVPGFKFKNCSTNPNEWQRIEEAAGKLIKNNLFVDDRPNQTIEYIRAKCRQRLKRKKLTMVVIDYLQLITVRTQRGKTRVDEVSEISRACKNLARELNVPVLLLSQLNRASEAKSDKKPSIAELRESGAIEQDADIVILIHRPEMYANRGYDIEHTPGKGELLIEKNRNGAIGSIPFAYTPEVNKIYDWIDPLPTPKKGNVNYHNETEKDQF
jgi:replicative DNA helicase